MKKNIIITVLILLSCNILSAQDAEWPRQLTNGGSVLTLYQPQVDSWLLYQTLAARMAFSLVPYQGKEVVGVIDMTASTNVNMDDHMVTVSNIAITQTHFPSLDSASADSMGTLVRSFLTAGKTVNISLDQLVACTEKKEAPPTTVKVNNDPPLIFVSYAPAILIQVEGKPKLVSANNQDVEFVFNTNWPLFFYTKNSTYYLFDDQEWQQASQVSGPWKFTSSIPKELQELSGNPAWSDLKKAVPPLASPSPTLPQVFYCEQPGEIILFEGKPVLENIPGTTLQFAKNTDSDVFFCTADKFYYYLTAGRWFSSQSLDGPWIYATPELPSDFAKIPQGTPASRVLVSVPGTEEAEDAIMIAQIPTTIDVPKDAASQVNVTYSGNPSFAPIQGTTMEYAVNTADKVIKLTDSQYYLCYQGIWFSSSAPTGPWTVSLLVPQVIYTIPASSPVYNVTFVTQTVTTTGTVQASYTAGYMGVFIVGFTAGAIIASGTGYYHPPYFYYPPVGFPVCYPCAMTYGAYAYHPYPYYAGVAHASYNPYTGNYARSATAYGPYGSAHAGESYNPSTGTMARGASVSSPYGTRSAAQAYNPYTGASGVTHQGSSPYAQWGSSSVSNGHGESATAGHVTTSQGTTGGVKTSNGDMYADHNGNVYKNDNGSWSKYDNGGWNQVNSQKPQGGGANSVDHSQGQGMSNDMQDRQRGGFQSQQFNGGGRSSFGGFSGGGSFGGGGFRGRR
jgi:uncharacterized membrane protein YgcG